MSNALHQLFCRYGCGKTQNLPTKGLKLRGTEGKDFKRSKQKGVSAASEAMGSKL